ncbi:MAG TPA: HlyD family efflux transporter periplasmic adaptor subunit [Solirubrobacteraceae bacterium]|jgi:multidrug efflux pump subunit AcrA (membrane-fusion protein)|nr:HlyD family efflux transporter periplasmic adaptor subunit [Solirubrobacteraceae bacterium]
MTERTRASWPVYALGALSAGAIVVAILVVGPASGNSSAVTRTATAAEGVVQSTVSGSGALQASSQLDLGFKTSGVISEIYVSQGQRVTEGRLLAELNPKSAEVTLAQSRATLQTAEANLAQVEEHDGEISSGSGSGGSGGSGSAGAGSAGSGSSGSGRSAAVSQSPGESPSGESARHSGSSTPSSGSSSSSASGEPESEAVRAANIASARAAVQGDRLAVEGDEQALADTKLYAPKTGTIVSLTGEVGEDVSAQGTTKASSSGGSSGGSDSSGSGAGGTSAGSSGRSGAGTSASSGSSDSSTSSSSAFAVLSDLSSMQLVVPLSESEIGSVRDGQTATVTVEALDGDKLAAHVNEVATLSTSNSGVVSYDVTFQLDQMAAGLKPGMSATAEVVVKQAEGVNVPTSAISGETVTVMQNGKQARRRVVTGLAGNSSTIILDGLRAGEKVLLPTATSTGASSLSSRLGRALGGGGGGALGGGGFGGGGGGGGGGGVFFRGGG